MVVRMAQRIQLLQKMVARMAERRIENNPPTLPSAPLAGKVVSLLQFSVMHQHIVSDRTVLHLYTPNSVALSGKPPFSLPMQPWPMRSWFVHRVTQAWPVLMAPRVEAWQVLMRDLSWHFGPITCEFGGALGLAQ